MDQDQLQEVVEEFSLSRCLTEILDDFCDIYDDAEDDVDILEAKALRPQARMEEYEKKMRDLLLEYLTNAQKESEV